MAAELGFPVAYGVTQEQAATIGAWWEPRRHHIQPAEFILKRSGSVISSTYSSSPVGRLDPDATLQLITFLNKNKK